MISKEIKMMPKIEDNNVCCGTINGGEIINANLIKECLKRERLSKIIIRRRVWTRDQQIVFQKMRKIESYL